MLGWVKLHRKILDNGIFTGDSDLLKVFVWCLLKASHKQHQIGMNTIEPGQFLTGRISASQELNIKPTTVRNKLNQLQQKKYVKLLTTNKFSIVTIVNWNTYQVEDSTSDSESKTNIDDRENDFINKVYEHKDYESTMLDNFILYWTERNKSNKKMKFELQKTWSTTRRLQTWSKRSFSNNNIKKTNQQQPKSKIAESLNKWQEARNLIENQNNK
tara:strand:- start:2170 stop:2814 length:645 start_codon:yes stop_codon:yes gene_type:complete